MHRRSDLKLGAVATGRVFVGAAREPFAPPQAATTAIPTVGQLVLTSTIGRSHDAVLPRGPLRGITARRTTGTQPSLVSEHGLGYYLESFVGDTRRAVF